MLEKALDFLFPKKCVICSCEGKHTLCLKCRPLLQEIKYQGCPFCFNKVCQASCFVPGLQFKSCFEYNNYSGKIIKDLKYHAKTENADLIANLIFLQFSHIFENSPLILPVNTSFIKQIQRKHNAPSLILFYLYKIFKREKIKVESAPYAIIKRNSKTQVGLSREERIFNIRSTFDIKNSYKDKLQGKDLIILDDVITTGSTILSCAAKVQQFNPSGIIALSFAQVLQK